jgi:nucleoid-associated protein YgaU
MGTFEKLGILVIVVIIVMILAVAIYQWGPGGSATGPDMPTPDLPDPLKIRYLDELEALGAEGDGPATGDPAPVADMWPGGIPRVHVIQPGDKVWILVVKRWKLNDSFVAAIEAANPAMNVARLRPGRKLVIPDPSSYMPTKGAVKKAAAGKATRRYEIQIGDTLENIAYRHLGARHRWQDIVALNPGLNPKRLMEGQEIYLPLK